MSRTWKGKCGYLHLILFLSFLVGCRATLNYNHEDCTQMKNGVNCVIEATFGRIKTSNETVDVHINCATKSNSNPKLLNDVQFAKIEVVVWDGCQAHENLKGFGLSFLSRQSQVKNLQIEHFAVGTLDNGVFDKFSSLENLSLLNNLIENLATGCFEGLKSLRTLELRSNHLQKIAAGVLSDMPKLSSLEINEDSERLFIASTQFSSSQVVDQISLAISRNSIGIDFLEHLISKSKNLSVIINKNNSRDFECEQTMLNGYGRNWIIESLKVENFRCGFMMSDIDSIKSLELNEILLYPYPSVGRVRLKGLSKLEKLSMHRNDLQNVSAALHIDDDSLRNLQILNLSYNRMQEFDIQIFEKCEKLEQMDLVGNALSTLGNFKRKDTFHVLVDGNVLQCSWLKNQISQAEFVFEQNFEGLNIRGLSCVLDHSSSTNKLPSPEAITKLSPSIEKEIERVNSIALMSIIFTCSLTLGVGLTLLSLHLYNIHCRRHQPFYRMLHDSLPLPATSHVRRTNFRGNATRHLPPTNYECPISVYEHQEMTSDVAESSTTMTSMDTQNVYEEIPVKIFD